MEKRVSSDCPFQNETIISDIMKLFGIFGPKANSLHYNLLYSFILSGNKIQMIFVLVV